MIAIYASKLYKALSADAKKRVQAALNNPMNSELVVQLKSYLDEEYQDISNETPEDADTASNESTAEGAGTATDTGSDSSDTSSAAGESFGDKVDDIEEDLGDMPMGDGSDDAGSDTEDVAESVSVKGKTITASSSLLNAPIEIKGMLNLDGDTCGVALVNYNDNELWVYYQDDVNLNNIMYNVIEKINSSGYGYLTFNRLARSDNAMVFDVGMFSTGNEVEPIETEKDEK